ncbi:D-alanine--D-alanine ligase [Clostridium bovifaecis]|uniref:D-alanine--D-alanine ligase n=1 Tax=Clostridium bovifaecis TaxID=2184719 RepID=A0A6I6EKV0_9CLOT|nr:D-alanine--D-alanine ligase [Clostridium bovifaecis]
MQIGVIMGGVSSEKEISLMTGKEIIDNLDKSKYEVLPVPIDTKFQLTDRAKCLEFAFIALHGSFGEDGKVQAILDSLGVPYSGSGVLSSALCMDKDLSKKIFIAENIKTPKWVLIKKLNKVDYSKIEEIGYPLIIKPNSEGSSIGISIVNNKYELEETLNKALKYDDILVEKFIKGQEITCCMLDGKVLPIIAINYKTDFFDYRSKYDAEKSEEVIVELDDYLKNEVEKISLKCWESFNLKVYCRIDMIVKDDNVYVLEINTLPGMTKNSLLPKSAKAYGLKFNELLDKIIEISLRESKN